MPDSQNLDQSIAALVQSIVHATEGWPGTPGRVDLVVIGEDGAAQQQLEAIPIFASKGEEPVSMRWEHDADIDAVIDGRGTLSTFAHAGRLVIDGPASAVNQLASALSNPGSRGTAQFIPFVTRASEFDDRQLQSALDRESIEALLTAQLLAQAQAYTLVGLHSETGDFRGRWCVGGVSMDMVVTQERCYADLAPTVEPTAKSEWAALAWMRWIGTNMTVIDALIAGQLSLSGDISVFEKASRILRHVQ